MIKRVFITALSLVFLTTAVFAGGESDSSSAGDSDIKVAIVTDTGGLGDQAYNDAGYKGLMLAKEDFGVFTTVLESEEVTEYETNLNSVGAMGFNVVFALGSALSDAVRSVASNYPETMYVIIDGNVNDIENVLSIRYREQESAFLAGALAAKMTKTKKIGFVLGMKIPVLERFETGYIAGARFADEGVEVKTVYTGKFNDPGLGKETAFTLYGDGADIVAAAAGACNLGVFDAAKQKGGDFWAMGAAAGQSHLAPEDILADQVKRIDNTIYHITQTYVTHGLVESGETVLTLAEDAVGLLYGENPAGISNDIFSYIEDLKVQIEQGEITVPSNYSELDSFMAQ